MRDTQIRDVALQCRTSFEKSLSFAPLMCGEWAENRLADFNLWSSGAGVFAPGSASFDWRLSSENDLKAVYTNLLHALKRLVDDCQVKAQNISNDHLKNPIGRSTNFLSVPKYSHLTTQLQGSREIEESQTGLSLESSQTALDKDKAAVEVVMKQILRLTISIRRSGVRSRLQKADKYFDSEDHQELKVHLEFLIRQMRQSQESRPLELTSIQCRLVEANLRRRHRFTYAQRHSEKLAKEELLMPEHKPQEPPPIRILRPWGSTLLDNLVTRVKKWATRTRSTRTQKHELIGSHVFGDLSATSATPVKSSIELPFRAPSTTATSNVSSINAMVEYPPPPYLMHGQGSFKCPYCCQTLAQKYAQESNWRKHLAEDILPYTCILEGCPTPRELYSSRAAWMDHMKSPHECTNHWICPICPVPRTFETEAAFESHLQETHQDAVPTDAFPALALACSRSILSRTQRCPLCPFNVHDVMLDHIAEHVHSFSLRSLPWDLYEADIDANRDSSMSSPSHEVSRTSHREPLSSDELYEALYAARVEDPLREHHFFIPENAKDSIITKDVIAQELRTAYQNHDSETIDEKAKEAHSHARNVFAILAYIRKGGQILEFLDEQVFDEDLPLERGVNGGKCPFSLQRRNGGGTVQVLERWDSSNDREAFSRDQWLMLAPVFKDMKHYVLHQSHVLPFIAPEPGDPRKDWKTTAGYSEMFTARIHKAHHRFCQEWSQKDGTLEVVVKKLLTKDRKRFENEQSILQKLGNESRPHLHLVRMLASYEVNGEFFLIFPRAHCNLRTYWEEHPDPKFDKATLRWSLEQMRGIATALYTIHHFRVEHPLIVGRNVRTPQKDVKLKVSPGEELFGRHGDIKPENIIWFQNGPGNKYGDRGTLQITDFGLGRFHRRDSRIEYPPHHIVASPTYEPPECVLQRPVSRKYDLWSLGCVYIEFATWLLRGSQDIEYFSHHRGQQSSLPIFSDDNFFTTVKEANGEIHAYVRDGVHTWVRDLHNDPKCSEFLHNVLDLVMDELLKVDATERIETGELCRRFNDFREKANKSDEYLLESHPRIVRGSKSHEALKPMRSRKSVTFAD